MSNFLPGVIMGFREGLEAFLVIAIILRYLSNVNAVDKKKYVWQGVFAGVGISLLVGVGLQLLSSVVGGADIYAKAWESISSLVALGLVTTFIIWMMKHSHMMTAHIEGQVEKDLSARGILLISAAMVAREGVEVALFTFVGKYDGVPVFSGVAVALLFAVLIFYSMIRVNLKTIFNVTLLYLILQAGFLLGYSLHEGLSALKEVGILSGDSFLFTKAFDLSKTVLNHKEGIIGVPLYALIGWYSKPEWIQFVVQYGYTGLMLYLWKRQKNKAN